MAAKSLRRELGKKRPFDSPETEAIGNILRTSDRLQNRFGRLFREYGLTGSQYNVLRILRGEGKPLPVLEIGSRMIQVVPAMTGLVDRLETQGLVRRERCTEDRRVCYIAITERGLKLLAQIDAPLEALHRQMVGHMSRRELTELIRLLEKARDRVAEVVTEEEGA